MYKYDEGDIVVELKTSSGVITVLLETSLAPITANNFLGLVSDGYYDGIIFHRIIKGFMIQGGDPDGTGMGGTSIYGDKFVDEFHPDLKNNKYTLSMANSGPNTNGSQFFINVADNNYLDNKHSVFGEVVDGFDNVDKISKSKTDSSDRPEKEVKIITAKIKEFKGGSLKDYSFDKKSAIDEYNKSIEQKQEDKKSLEIQANSKVKVHYTGTLESGDKFDSSYDRGEPLEFVAGSGQMIPGFDKAIHGMKIGQKKSITLTPSEAYGEYSEDNKQVVPKTDLQSFVDAGIPLEKDSVLPTQFGPLTIVDTDEKTVTVDTNHQLAGKTLNFDIEIVDID